MDTIKDVTQPSVDNAAEQSALEKAATHYDMVFFRESVGKDDAYTDWVKGNISLIERAMEVNDRKS